MELEHFSHPEHPLSLTNKARLDEWGNIAVCYGCDNPIGDSDDDVNSTFYECATCQFYLHKPCAEAPLKIIHSKHSRHPLFLYSEQPYERSSSCICNVCQRSGWKWFTYHCARCEFDVDIICALKDMDNIYDVNKNCRSLKHKGHRSLTLQLRSVQMKCYHFSHEHQLSLTNEACLDESANRVVCYACRTPIGDGDSDNANSTFYECDPCEFYLHKRCAEMPEKIIYSKHRKHPLTLFSEQPYLNSSTCVCIICKRGDWQGFTYHCSECKFDVDIICALKDMNMICDANEDRSIEHASHEHSLTVQQRPALFHCNACDTERKDFSYTCATCDFWIHKKCALLPRTMKFSHHNHDLHLDYYFPLDYRRYSCKCEICRKKLDSDAWIYHCIPCRYFVHMNCAITTYAIPERDDEDYENLEKFPINGDRSTYLISEFVKKSLGDCDAEEEEEEEEIQHWNHIDHPLLLWDGQSNNSDIVYEGMRCVACIQPITSPFYHCSQCSYFIHRHCAFLPLELKHEADQDHPLKLMDGLRSIFSCFWCTLCDRPTSGFFYSCEICKIFIGIDCISYPTKILHNCHPLPLVRTSKVLDRECEVCVKTIRGFAYQCEICGYSLHYKCATRYQRITTHDYDEHPIYLKYPPIEDLSYPICEICENDIHPKSWMYYCELCRFHFHLDCLHDHHWQVRGKYEDSNHPHLLTLILDGGCKSPCLCERCGQDLRYRWVLKCDECGFTICLGCAT